MSLGPQDTTGASGPCSHMASFLHDRGFSWHLQMARGDCVYWQWFLEVFLAHLVMSMTGSCWWVMQCRLRARRPQASNRGLRPCPLCTEISTVSLNLLMMVCTVDDDNCKAFAIWCLRTLFLKYSTIFYARFHTLESLSASLLLRDSALDIPFMLQTWCQLT